VDGTGTMLEITSRLPDEREFFTIETVNGNIFHIVVDKERENHNVYLLVAAQERDLMGFVDGASAPVPLTPVITPPPSYDDGVPMLSQAEIDEIFAGMMSMLENTVDTEEEPDEENDETGDENEPDETATDKSKRNNNNNMVTYIVILILAALGAGAGYYFKVYRKQQDFDEADDFNDMS
jgi:hypothetical protein